MGGQSALEAMELVLTASSTEAQAHLLFCGWEPYQGPWEETVKCLVDAGRFHPNKSQVKVVTEGKELLLLLGRPEREDPRHIMELVGQGIRTAREERVKSLEIDLDTWHGETEPAGLVREIARAARMANYVFDDYKTDREQGLTRITVKFSGAGREEVRGAFAQGDRLGQAVVAVRGAVNRTSRDMTPPAFTDWVLALSAGGPYQVEVVEEDALRAAGAKALLSVSAASQYPPRLVVMRYQGDHDHPDQVTALLGKGVTFDSGGLSLKSKTGMITMHHDMGGAAATAAAFDAVARTGLPINLTAVLPVCENMLSPTGYRPGDVIGTMDGKSVLIKSTDAEGRLILADAMTWAIRREGAKRLVDLATLTGGAVAAFGPLINALAVEDDTLRRAVWAASATSGELVWEMPLLKDYMRYLKSDHADLANSSNGAGSSMVNGALFLQAFAQDLPWLHIDSAGTSWADKTAGCFSYGATGAGTVLLFDLVRQLAGQDKKRTEEVQ